MAFRFGQALKDTPPQTGPTDSTVMPDTLSTHQVVEQEIRLNEASNNAVDSMLEQPTGADYFPPSDSESIEGQLEEIEKAEARKLSKLVSDDFPFDESQLEAIDGLANQQYGCLTGAAGTGKTTSTKAIVDRIQDSIGSVDMTNYFKTKNLADDADAPLPEDDDYEAPESAIPSICLVGFTGRSTQMIKKNFPRDWHGNIMTIHRMLAYAPEWYEGWDEATGSYRNKMRFIPTYNRFLKLPWDVIVIDEAGMVSVELWEQIWAAAKDGCRIIMIGDINQLPPVHGRSIFGFAMTKWPSWELTHIHRQTGQNNSIVDNAWRILKGLKPLSDDYKVDPSWKFAMMPIPEDSVLASQKIRKWLETMNGRAYQPHRDSVITAINGEEASARGASLGQIPMNRELAIVFNKENPRFIIDAGRERKQFAVGDKVMATRNDHEAGITNGMTGVITKIEDNGAYAGDKFRFGEVSAVGRYLEDVDDEDEEEFSLDDISESFAAINDGIEKGKESKDRGPASHIVTVRFGEAEHSFEMPFASLAEVATLMTAYVVTCHKMQGGESPLVVVILHQAHKAMHNREWLYTAVTRASQKCVLFYTDMGLRSALNKQRITGKNLQEKIKVFQALQTQGITGAAINVELPDALSLGTALQAAHGTMLQQTSHGAEVATTDGKARLEAILAKAKPKAKPAPVIERVVVIEREVHIHHVVREREPDSTVDHGTIKSVRVPPPPPPPSALQLHNARQIASTLKALAPKPLALPAPAAPIPLIRQEGAVRMIWTIEDAMSQKLLPAPKPQPTTTGPTKFRFGVKK